jgi:hypothetical protein
LHVTLFGVYMFQIVLYLIYFWISHFIIADLYPQSSGKKLYINPATAWSYQDNDNTSTESLNLIKSSTNNLVSDVQIPTQKHKK